MRITALANFDRWREPARGRVPAAKLAWYDRHDRVGRAVSARFSPRGGRQRHVHSHARSAASPGTKTAPCTARPTSAATGTTHLKNLFICGTDQGLVGIIGAMISGIAMANRHLLRKEASPGTTREATDIGCPTPASDRTPHLLAMPKDFLQGARDRYDVIVIGSGLAGMTAANTLARSGHSVLLLEQHYKLGGMATWFKRPGGHIFDISLHGFPVGMIKSCRRYWTSEIADSIVQLKNIRFDNPMFSLTTTFNREDFTRLLVERFGVPAATVAAFFDAAAEHEFLRRPVDDRRRDVRAVLSRPGGRRCGC